MINPLLLCPCCGKGADVLSPILIINLREFETILGKPLNYTSGYRCKKHNKDVGGVENSSHTKGFAADIAVKNSEEMYRAAQVAMTIFKRVGISSKGSSHFLHVDNDPLLPSPRLWSY